MADEQPVGSEIPAPPGLILGVPQIVAHPPPPLPQAPQDGAPLAHIPLSVQDVQAAEAEALAVADGARAAESASIQALPTDEAIRRIHDEQVNHTQLITNMQSVIHNMTTRQNELEDEIKNLKGGRWVVRAEPSAAAAPASKRARTTASTVKGEGINSIQNAVPPTDTMAVGFEGPSHDDEIDAIIESRKDKKQWPLKRKYCTAYSQELDLFKLRFHRSEKYHHKSIRIPKVDKNEGYGLGNKEGRLICRLCSGKTINRNTSWMCGTCQVPLCVDIINGNPESSCHARWHNCEDLVSVNHTLNTALRERRESKKRNRDSTMNLMEEEQPQQVVVAPPLQARHHEIHHPQQQEMMKQEQEQEQEVHVPQQQVVQQLHHPHEVVAMAAPVEHVAAVGAPIFLEGAKERPLYCSLEEAHQVQLAADQQHQQQQVAAAAAEVAVVAALEVPAMPEPAPVGVVPEEHQQQHVVNHVVDVGIQMAPPEDVKMDDPNHSIVL